MLENLQNKKIKIKSFRNEAQFKEFKELGSEFLHLHRIENLEFKNLHSLYIDNEYDVNFINNSAKADIFFDEYNFDEITGEKCMSELNSYKVYTHYGVVPQSEDLCFKSSSKIITVTTDNSTLNLIVDNIIGYYLETTLSTNNLVILMSTYSFEIKDVSTEFYLDFIKQLDLFN